MKHTAHIVISILAGLLNLTMALLILAMALTW